MLEKEPKEKKHPYIEKNLPILKKCPDAILILRK